MAEGRDSEIKLFGKTIQILLGGGAALVATGEKCSGDDEKAPANKETSPEPRDNNEETLRPTEEKNNESIILAKEDENMDPKSAENEQNESNSNPPDNFIKKPDKILPCPRCKSMDTKFCYFNNYNVNQPRHFCKSCQRYWTAGGSMRNVPVGAGRRKSKCLTANQHFRHITIPDCVRLDSQSNGTVLNFGSNATLSESMTSAVNLIEKTMKNSAADSNDQAKVSSNSNCVGFQGNSWAYPWAPPPFTFPLYPMTAYWGMPWLSPHLSSSQSSGSSCSVSSCQYLGKHSRDGNLLNPNHSEKRLWIPKTIRVDNTEKLQTVHCDNSITINKDLLSNGGGFFKAFQSSGDHKVKSTEISQVLLANPAALSRSFTFQESS